MSSAEAAALQPRPPPRTDDHGGDTTVLAVQRAARDRREHLIRGGRCTAVAGATADRNTSHPGATTRGAHARALSVGGRWANTHARVDVGRSV
jgi:hypothetical protein